MSEISVDDIEDLPPSCKFVYKEVERHGPIRRQDLIGETWLAERTMYDVLERLENRGFITVTRDSDDLRQVVVKIASV